MTAKDINNLVGGEGRAEQTILHVYNITG